MSRRDSRGTGRAPSQRQLRVGEELRHALAEVLERETLRDPVLSNQPITVTEVRISPDLRAATAFVIPLGGAGTEAVVEALNGIKPFLRRRVAQAVRLRFVPDLVFKADQSFDAAAKVERLLEDPAVRRDLGGPGSDEDDGA